jgi:hypothetical protein
VKNGSDKWFHWKKREKRRVSVRRSENKEEKQAK